MFRVALASVRGNKIRLALTGLAIILGVAFVAGTLTLTDSLNRAFTDVFETVNQDVDVYVNGASQVEADFASGPIQRPRFEQSVADRVAAVDGVERVVPFLEGFGQVIDRDRNAIGGQGPPTLALSWEGPDSGGPLTLLEGAAPSGPDQTTLDAGTAESTGYEVGDQVPVVMPSGRHEFTVVGITGFGDQEAIGGSTIVTFDLATLQELQDDVGLLTSLAVTAEGGVDGEGLRDRIATVVADAPVEVVTGQEQTDSDIAEIEQGLSFLNIALLVFAGIALFVGIFLIVNTFSIIVAQRTREFALLRAVGASAGQVRLTVVVEAVVVGLLSGVVGLALGVGLAQGLRVLFDAIGFGFPQGSLVVAPRTIVVALVIGVVITALASLAPARRAARISPMEALRNDASTHGETISRGRSVVGGVALVTGVAALVAGLLGAGLTVLGIGAALGFTGVTLLAPLLAGPVASVVGGVPARFGLPGRLARSNASANPKRTASTASALMIGVALVSFVSIFASSAIASVNSLFTTSLGADFIITTTDFSGGGVPPAIAEDLATRPEIGAVTPVRDTVSMIGDVRHAVVAVSTADVGELIELEVTAGEITDATDGLMVHADRADREGWAVGDVLDITFPNGPQQLAVVGIYANRDVVGAELLTDLAVLDRIGVPVTDQLTLANVADGTDVADTRAVIDAAAGDFPAVNVQDQTEFTQSLRGQVDTLLNIMIGLLGLALVIALIGIINTLALSVFERTREIGLLRAVGMTRRQARSMVRWESVIVAVFGALLGVAVGTVFGWAFVTGGAESGLGTLEIPVGRLAMYVVIAGFAGVLAAVAPARRAARLDVLEAVTTE